MPESPDADVQFYYMSLMPCTRLPDDEADYAWLWADFPNRLYDAVHGPELLDRYLDEYVEANRIGFDGVVVNEHYSTAYSLKPTTNLVASALIQRTRRTGDRTTASLRHAAREDGEERAAVRLGSHPAPARAPGGGPVMGGFEREHFTIGGVDTTVPVAGEGPPLVLWHGAGTFIGFDFALEWARKFRVYVPYHPGFGESALGESITAMHDYVTHCLCLLDALGLECFRMVGHSRGGWLAAAFATEHAHWIKRLALLSPVGLRVIEHPTIDIFKIRPHQLPGYLISNPALLQQMMSAPPMVDMIVQQYREMTSAAHVARTRTSATTLPRWLHRVRGQAAVGTLATPGPGASAGKLPSRLVIEDPAAVQAAQDFMRRAR